MVIKIIRKWYDKFNRFTFGTDETGKLHCRDINAGVNLVLVDPYYKKNNKYYYKFVYPDNDRVKLVPR